MKARTLNERVLKVNDISYWLEVDGKRRWLRKFVTSQDFCYIFWENTWEDSLLSWGEIQENCKPITLKKAQKMFPKAFL